MVGHKTRRGPKVQHKKYFFKGKRYVQTIVVCPKPLSGNYRKLLSASCVETGDIPLNHQGRPQPWQTIQWDEENYIDNQ